MAIWFISRHSGAINWIKKQNIHIDHWCEHFDANNIVEGDVYIGTLPIHLAAKIHEKKGIFYFLEVNTPQARRGQELTENELDQLNCKLTHYTIKREEQLVLNRIIPTD